MHLFYHPDTSTKDLSIEDSRHAIKVLRLGNNDEIELTDGKGNLHVASITHADPKKCQFKLTRTTAIPKRSYSIHLAVAPTKNMDRMEWMVEKCTEVGVDKISFVQCKTSERKSLSIERLQKIAISALKQSRQAWLPDIAGMVPFMELLPSITADQRYIAFVDDSNPDHLTSVIKLGGSYVLLIGPEGDFTDEEIAFAIEHGFRKVSLGPNRLRTETAGVYGVVAIAARNLAY